MKDKHEMLRALEASIDKMDMEAIDHTLEILSSAESLSIQAEDPKLFSTRILKLNQEDKKMKHPNKALRITFVAAAVAIMGVTVYAVTNIQNFSFQSGDRFVTMRTNESLTEQQAKEMVETNQKEAASANASGETPSVEATEIPTKDFDSPEKAASEMDMILPLPSKMPAMSFDNASGQTLFFGEGGEDRTVWIEYSDENGRMLGITVVREIIPAGGPITSYTMSDIDEGSLGTYKSKSGITYTTLNESDDSGESTANIATTTLGEYEYSLVFVGFDEAQRQEIIDSTDLSAYQK